MLFEEKLLLDDMDGGMDDTEAEGDDMGETGMEDGGMEDDE